MTKLQLDFGSNGLGFNHRRLRKGGVGWKDVRLRACIGIRELGLRFSKAFAANADPLISRRRLEYKGLHTSSRVSVPVGFRGTLSQDIQLHAFN